MALPTLIIGLGGTGLQIATQIKKNLLEGNRNRLPPEVAILVLDTEREVKYRAAAGGQGRDAEPATGPVKIDSSEYIALTGNMITLAEAIRNEQNAVGRDPARRDRPYRHLSGWFQARYYLDEANPPAPMWNLDKGAGRYRQFGRLAFFRHIDGVEKKLSEAIAAVQRASGGQTLGVHIVGSLAGGTGAALFADVAHLVQWIVKDVGYNADPVVLGHFVLAEAFRGTRAVKLAEPGVRQSFNARMFAALRELTRLQSNIIPRSGGYSIDYDPQGKGARQVLLQVKPYNAVYLYDGVAERIQLNQRPLDDGLAPAIADIVTAYIDEKSGGAFRSHSVNYDAFYSAYNIPAGTVTYGSAGVYTIELPVYHITEGWAHRLAAEMLEALLLPDPSSFDRETGVPSRLQSVPRGNLQAEAETWRRNNTTSLINQICGWGEGRIITKLLDAEPIRSILALSADDWLQQFSPAGPGFASYVDEAYVELKASLLDSTNAKYYVELNQGGGSAGEKAFNLRFEIDDRLHVMIGDSVDVWRRQGGDCRRALIRLANIHLQAFQNSLIKTLANDLNGSGVGNAIDQKSGKLGFVLGFLSHLESLLAGGMETLALADRQSQAYRRPQFDRLDMACRTAFAKLQQGGGLLGGNARAYREKCNDLAQFHKADIARQVAHDLAVRLHKDVAHLLAEARRWEAALATAAANDGGAYAQLLQGRQDVERDRRQSENAARWVISDNEPGDHYIADKYDRYAAGQLAEILSRIEWRVGRADDGGELRLDFTLAGQPWDREAGQPQAAAAGQRNVRHLLALCRRPFDPAWSDMSVTAYLYQNFYAEANQLDHLAERIYRNSDTLLGLNPLSPEWKMRTAFVRVYQDKVDHHGDAFLRALRAAVDRRFEVATTAEQRQPAEGQIERYMGDRGLPSTDPFKLSFLVYNDLLLPEDIQAFDDGRDAYRRYSDSGQQWRELHVFPAETNALQLERSLPTIDHRRREFDPDVVTLLEDVATFQTAVRCLAYGEQDFAWGIGDETGLLLHAHTPPENNPAGYSYWRLALMPEGQRGADGVIYDKRGAIARPLAYQLTPREAEPSLLEAFIQLTGRQSDYDTGRPIDWARVEATLAEVLRRRRDQWGLVEEMGWRLLPDSDPALEGELKDKAAQLVRLGALREWLDNLLEQHRWAWSRNEGLLPPRVADNRTHRDQIQKQVDLLTAIRSLAQQESDALARRLGQIGVQFERLPPDRPVVSWSPDAEATPPAEVEQTIEVWLCANGHANPLEYPFCGDCGLGRPALLCLNGHELQPGWTVCPVCGAAAAPLPAAAPPAQVWPALTAAVVPARPRPDAPIELRCRIDARPLVAAGRRGELTLLVEAPGMYIQEPDRDSETFLLDADTPAQFAWSVRLRARQPGRQQVLLRPFLNGVAGPETRLDVTVRGAPAAATPAKLLPFPDAPAGQLPDLILRSYATPEADGTAHRLVFYAFSPHRRLALLGQPFGEVRLEQAALQRFRSRLALALAAARPHAGEDLRAALQALGAELHDWVLPVEVQQLYREVGPQVRSLLLLHDLEPWIPWELIYFAQEGNFLPQARSFGRWIEGLGVPRVGEFPIGQVSLALTANARAVPIAPGAISELFDPAEFPPLRGEPLIKAGPAFFAGLDYRSTIWGLHIEHSLAAGPATTSLATVAAPPDTLALARDRVLDLRRRQPLITMGCGRAETATPELTGADTLWGAELIKRGASAFVGSLWTVAAESSRLFWSELYSQVWRAVPLGLAVWQARQAVAAAFPESPDWLSFFLLGDPAARGYRPEASQGYVTVECPDHDLTQEALRRDHSYTLLASLRLTPPLWNPQRRGQVIEDSWIEPRVHVFGPAFDAPAAPLELVDTSPGVRVARFTITPHAAGEQDLLIRFLSGPGDSRHSIALRLRVEE